MPLPLAMEQLIRQVMQVFPALALLIIAPTGGDQMQMGMVLTIAAMGVEHHDGATLESLAPDLAIKIIQALPPTPHQGAQHDRGVMGEGRVEHRAHLADPGIHVDFGAPQAQRGLTAHRHPMGALSTLQATVFNIAHLVGISTPEPLRYQALVVGRLVTWMGVFEPVPVLSKDLLEDIPVPCRCYTHQGAPS